MGIHVNENTCNGCGTAEEPMCVRDCPGDLMVLLPNRKAVIRDNRECWDCAACVKVCPTQAITMRLPTSVAVSGVALRGRAKRHKTEWRIENRDGSYKEFETPSRGKAPFYPNL